MGCRCRAGEVGGVSGIGRTTPIGTRTPWSFVKQNEGVGGFSPHNGVRCSSSAAGSQPGTVCSFNKTKNATVTPSAATSRSSPGDLNVSTSLRRGALHGAEIASSTHTSAAGGLAPERAARPAKSMNRCAAAFWVGRPSGEFFAWERRSRCVSLQPYLFVFGTVLLFRNPACKTLHRPTRLQVHVPYFLGWIDAGEWIDGYCYEQRRTLQTKDDGNSTTR